MIDDSDSRYGTAAIEMAFDDDSVGEPAIVGCTLSAEGRWATCIRARGGAPQLVRSRISSSRWGVIFTNCDGRIEDCEFTGLGEAALVLIGGATWLHRNTVFDCGGPGIVAASDCHAVLEANEVKDCITGVRVVGKRAEIEMRAKNRLLHNGLIDEHQLEAPPGVIPAGSTMMVRSCRPYPFLPKGKDAQEQLLQR